MRNEKCYYKESFIDIAIVYNLVSLDTVEQLIKCKAKVKKQKSPVVKAEITAKLTGQLLYVKSEHLTCRFVFIKKYGNK